MDLVDISKFEELEIRVGRIVDVEGIPDSTKLLNFSIDIGGSRRQIVSGIKIYYPNFQDLVGEKVIVLVNLKPIKIMGYLSEGMILSAEDQDGIELLSVNRVSSGGRVR